MTGRSQRSHYQVLGVTERATLADIRRAHRQLARLLHPDRLAGAPPAERSLAERRMREVNAAWTVLSDAERRRAYDRALQPPAASRAPGPAPAGSTSAGAGSAGAGSGRSGGRPWEAEDEFDRANELDPDEEPLSPLHFWLLRRGPVIAAVVVAVGLFVFTAYAGGGDGGETTRTTQAPQDCARVTDGRNAVTTACDVPNDGRLVTRVSAPLDCPPGTKYVVIDGGFHCVDGDAGQPLPGRPGRQGDS